MMEKQQMKVTKNDKRDALTITVSGKQYRTLAAIADALNAVEPGRHTPESVCRKFLMAAPGEMMDRPRDLADFILSDARFDGKARATAFRWAFMRAGLWGAPPECVVES